MKILVISHLFPPAIDGGSQLISSLIKAVPPGNNPILVFTTNCLSTDNFITPHQSINNNVKTSANFQVFRLPIYSWAYRPPKLLSLILSKIFLPPVHSTFSSYLYVLQKGPIFSLLSLLKIIIKSYVFQPDWIISGAFPTTTTFYGQFIHKLITLTSNHSCHLLIIPCFHPNDPLYHQPSLTNQFHHANLVATLSSYEANYIHTHFSVPKDQLIRISGGINKNSIINPKEISFPTNPTILYIGSLDYHKNIIPLINIFSEFISKFPNAKLIIAGQKTLYSPKILTCFNSQNHKTKKNISFIFRPSENAKRQLIDSCTALIQPSSQESFGLTLIESMARGKPVLANNLPQLAEIVNKTKAGLLFNIKEPSSLKKQLENLINNPKQCRRLGQNGFNYVSSVLTWDKIGQCLWPQLQNYRS